MICKRAKQTEIERNARVLFTHLRINRESANHFSRSRMFSVAYTTANHSAKTLLSFQIRISFNSTSTYKGKSYKSIKIKNRKYSKDVRRGFKNSIECKLSPLILKKPQYAPIRNTRHAKTVHN